MQSTPVASGNKRDLSSPEFALESFSKKSKTFVEVVMSSPLLADSSKNKPVTKANAPNVEVTKKHDSPTENTQHSNPVQNIVMPQEAVDKISEMLVHTFKSQIEGLVEKIATSVNVKLEERIQCLEQQNIASLQDNAKLRARVSDLELQLDRQEQYSRRNCLRLSGLEENSQEDTDDIVIKISKEIKIDLNINEIDRSHRVGKKKADHDKPRDIIVKFISYRSRQKLYSNRSRLKDSKYAGTFVNEDLTRRRSLLLYKARQLVISKHLYGAWSSDGNILVKDNKRKIQRIDSEDDIDTFLLQPPRDDDDYTEADHSSSKHKMS